ncbi:MAG: DUF7507 domain-containing protein [Thermoplasmatota archaeon]
MNAKHVNPVIILMFIVFIVGISVFHFSGEGQLSGDTAPPISEITYAGRSCEVDGHTCISDRTVIWLNTTDPSGVSYVHYEIWRDSNGDDVFETLEKEATVFDNSQNDSDSSPDIDINFTIASECHHKIEYFAVDSLGNAPASGDYELREEWNYSFQPHVTHCFEPKSFYYYPEYRKMVFGSSPAVANLLVSTPYMEIVCGSDELKNNYPETPVNKQEDTGLWRCWSSDGDIIWARITETDQARSSPAICDINGDGTLEIAAGTTSGWNVEVMDSDGNFIWTFPARRFTGGSFCWHSSPALVNVSSDDGSSDGSDLELIIGNNPYHSVWCFDGDNSDGMDNGITLPRGYWGDSPLFLWEHKDLGDEGTDWDVLWVFENSKPIIASPAVADIDNDGYKEVVIGSLDSNVFAINASSGTKKWEFSTDAEVYSSAALANLDDDPQLEVVVGSNDSFLYCIDGLTGMQQWRFDTGGAVYSSPSIGDVDGDGQLEIVFGSLDGHIYCVDTSGSEEWNTSTGGAVYSSAAFSQVPPLSPYQWPMFRLNCARSGYYDEEVGSTGLHIFIGSDDFNLYKLYGTNGSIISQFTTYGPIHTSPTVADIDRDGAVEIVFYDWGDEEGGTGDDGGLTDTFWCLEEPYYVTPDVEEIYVDVSPPQINKTVGDPHVEISSEEYYITSTTPITVTASDQGCCIGDITLEYKINDGEWQAVTGDIFIEEECTHMLYLRARDCLGNTAYDNETFHVDDTPPDSAKEVGYPRYGQDDEFVTTSTTFYINASDVGGCAVGARRLIVQVHRDDNHDHVFQHPEERVLSLSVLDNSINDNNPAVGVINVTISFGQECYHRIRWRAEDLLLNIGGWHNQYHYADDTPPTGIFDVGDPYCVLVPGEEYCITTGSPLWINATDEGATAACTVGDYILHWAIWNESGLYDSDTLDNSNATLSIGEECNHTLGYWTKDALGNRWPVAGYHNVTLRVDDKAPLVSISVGEPNCSEAPGGGYCVTTGTPITIDANDQGCCPGIMVMYRIWNNTYDAGWQTISTPYTFTFEEQCRHNLSVKAFDCLGNLVFENITFYVDDIAPVIIKTVGQPSQADVMGADFSIATITPITIDASPGCCPNMSVAYRVDEGEWIPADVPVTITPFSTEGYHTLDIRASDCLGHVSYDNETFYVEEYAPLLEIYKMDSQDPVPAGGVFNYTISVTNSGTLNATQVTVTDTYDENVSFVAASPSPSSGNDTWVFSTLNISETRTINITVRVHSPLESGTRLNNTVAVTCDEGVSNQTWEDTDVFSAPVLDIEKTAHDSNGLPLYPGDTISYRIFVNNTGSMNQLDNGGDELQDVIPGHAAFVDGSLTWSSGVAVYDAGSDMIRWNGGVDVGETVVIMFNVTVDFPLDNGTWINNTACLFWDSDGNNTNDATSCASANLSVVSSPELSIIKTDDPDPAHPGYLLNYTITVTNTGDANATDVVIQESYDDNVSFVDATPSPDVGDDAWNILLLQPGETVVIEVQVAVSSILEPTYLNNSVNVSCREGVFNETFELTRVISAPTLDIVKEAVDVDGAPLHPGDTIQYVIKISNTGDKHQLDNGGDELQDVIPGHAAFVDGSLTWSSGVAVYDAGSDMIRWNGGVDVGETVVIMFNVTVDFPLDNGTWINNTACLFWDSDGNNTNDATSCASANLSVVSSPELSIIKTDTPDPVMADSELVYRIWVNNSGNANATNVVVRESYPPGTTFVSATPEPLSPDGQAWHFSRINVGESKLIEIHVDVGTMPNGSVLLNEVNVTCDQELYNETTEETTVLSEPVLLINKTVSSAVVEQGGSITYSIVVSNTGTAPATTVIVQDTYDAAVTFAGAWPYPTSGNGFWDLGELAAGASETITVQVDILTEIEEGTTIVNYVNVTCAEGKEDQDWANVSITSEPPDTWKVFHGIVRNVTYYEGGEGYLIHYITSDTTITLKAIDLPEGAGSGVEHTYYRIFKWNDKAGKWEILFNWQEYGVWKTKHPYDPIDLYELGIFYGKTPCGKYQIEFYSVDKAGNFEGMEWNDVIVDCLPPASMVQPLPPVVENESVTVSATASDDAAVANVTLWYRYSEDNESWTDWTVYGTKTKPYTWEFTPPEGDGFYQFYSVAADYVGHTEAAPDASTTPDAWCEFTYAPWDVNNDGRVNILDVSFVADHWMETPSHPDWNPAADVNGDGRVDILDIVLIAEHWTG